MFKLINIKYKTKKIHDVIRDDKVIGHVYGHNLSRLEYGDENNLDEYVSKIKDTIVVEYDYIYFEEHIPLGIKKIISDRLSISLPNSKDLKVYNIPYIVEALKQKLSRDIAKEEILILSNNKEEVLLIIDKISSGFSFVSVLGLNDEDSEDVYEKTLDNTGISVYFPKKDSISLKKYGLIINTIDENSLDKKDIKTNTIIIDFSSERPFVGTNRYVIDDVYFDMSELGVSDNPWINKDINSDLYKCLNGDEYKRFCRIYKNGDLFTMEDFVNQSFKIKGGY